MTETPPQEGTRAQANTSAPDAQEKLEKRQARLIAEIIPLAEETVTVAKHTVERGGVRVRLVTDEIEQLARASLRFERIEIERVPIGREVERAPPMREEGDLTIIPVLEEVVVTQKRLVLREELHIRRVAEVREVTEPVTVRRQRAEIERIPAAGSGPTEPVPAETGKQGNQT